MLEHEIDEGLIGSLTYFIASHTAGPSDDGFDLPEVTMIEIRDLQFRYGEGVFELQIPSLRVGEGRKAAVIGPSGCGKTTLLHLLAGILAPSAGEIRVGELRVDRLGEAARRDFRIANVGFVFQDFELLDYLDVQDNILHPYRINRSLLLSKEVRERAVRLAEETGIGDKLHREIGHLSQGERQRVAVCRALIAQPKLLFADEATGNLDPENKERVMQILASYVEREGASLIAVTHDHELLHGFDQVIDFQTLVAGANEAGAS